MFKNRMTALIIGLILAGAIAIGFTACDTGDNGDGWVGEYSVGDTGPGGGIVFHVVPGGFTVEGYGSEGDEGYFASYTAHYLEAAPSNHASTVQWGDRGTAVDGITTFTSISHADANKIGNGRKDTQTIAAHMNGKGISGTAAQVAAASDFGDKSDWFLPSAGELNKMYEAKAAGGAEGLPTTGWFWSSSQYNDNNAWYLLFANGRRDDYYSKAFDHLVVRAVRAF